MKSITKAIATLALTLTIFAFPVLADCGEQTSGNRCLVQSPTTATKTTTTTVMDKKERFDLDDEIKSFFRNIFVKIFG